MRFYLKSLILNLPGVTEMSLRKAILKSFNSGDYTATIQLAGSYKTYLEGLTVARNVPAAEIAPGSKVGVLSFDQYTPKHAALVGVYT